MFFDRKTLAVAACLLTGTHTASAATEFHFTGDVTGGNYYGIETPFGNGDSFSAVLTVDTTTAATGSGSNSGTGIFDYAHYGYLSLEVTFGDLSWTYGMDGANGLTFTDGIQDQSRNICNPYNCSYVRYDTKDKASVNAGADIVLDSGLTLTTFAFSANGSGGSNVNHQLWSSTGIENLSDFNTVALSGGQTGGSGSLSFAFGNNSGYAYLNNILLTDVVDLSLVGGIPEPATWLMMITGFGLAGMASRRRQLRLA